MTPWALALFLLSPLVLFPIALRIERREPEGDPGGLLSLALRVQPAAAPLLVVAFVLPPGLVAATLSLPWLATTGLVALSGLVRVWRRGIPPLYALSRDAGLVFLSIGGVWATLSRAGQRPLNLPDIVVFLTAVHFHYAGFILPLATGWAGREAGGFLSRLTAVCVVAGVPFVAAGITVFQLGRGMVLESIAAVLTAIGGFGCAALHVKLALSRDWPRSARALWGLAAAALSLGMLLALVYGLRTWVPTRGLDIPTMLAFHGSLNALGFALPVTVGWWFSGRKR